MQLVKQDAVQSGGDQREPDPGPAHNVGSPWGFRCGEVGFGNSFSRHMRLSTGFNVLKMGQELIVRSTLRVNSLFVPYPLSFEPDKALWLDWTHRADGRHEDECRREDSYEKRQEEANHRQRTRLSSQAIIETREQSCRCQHQTDTKNADNKPRLKRIGRQ